MLDTTRKLVEANLKITNRIFALEVATMIAKNHGSGDTGVATMTDAILESSKKIEQFLDAE
jgi:hypothetical protein